MLDAHLELPELQPQRRAEYQLPLLPAGNHQRAPELQRLADIRIEHTRHRRGHCRVHHQARPANTADVLRTIERHGFTWGITSNTLLRKRIAELGSLHACRAWTASYHPHAHDREPFEQGARQVRSQAPQALYANLVISSHTAATAEDDTAWLHSLGIFDRINLLVDMYHDQQLAELATDICIRHHHTLAVGSGKTITGANCRRFDRFLVLNPTGDLYECVRKAYHGIDRIGNARDLVFQANGTIDHCTLDCPHTCDQTKHA